MRQVIFIQDEEGYWAAEVPSLPGCFSEGATIDEASSNIQEAIELYIDVLKEQGKPIPDDVPPIVVKAVAA